MLTQSYYPWYVRSHVSHCLSWSLLSCSILWLAPLPVAVTHGRFGWLNKLNHFAHLDHVGQGVYIDHVHPTPTPFGILGSVDHKCHKTYCGQVMTKVCRIMYFGHGPLMLQSLMYLASLFTHGSLFVLIIHVVQHGLTTFVHCCDQWWIWLLWSANSLSPPWPCMSGSLHWPCEVTLLILITHVRKSTLIMFAHCCKPWQIWLPQLAESLHSPWPCMSRSLCWSCSPNYIIADVCGRLVHKTLYSSDLQSKECLHIYSDHYLTISCI